MPISATSSQVALTRTLNDLHLAALDAAKLRAAQLESQHERQLDNEKAASRSSDQLRQRLIADTKETDAQKAINGDESAKRNQNRQQLQQRSEEENAPTLKSLVPAKAQLSPAEELETFAETSGTQSKSAISADAQSAQQLALTVNTGKAVDEEGASVEVEILTPQSQENPNSALVLTLQSRAQAATAALYARNSDVVFQSYPISQVAA